MPVEITDYDDGRGVVIYGSGVIGDQDRDKMFTHFAQGAEKLRRYLWTLSDFGDATGSEISPGTFRTVAAMSLDATSLGAQSVVAFVGTSDVVYGLSKVFEGMIAQTERAMEVFRTRAEAVAWIRSVVGDEYCRELIESLGD